jgi:predicted GNAT family N-acyltransferase
LITTEWFFGDENLTDAHMIRRRVFIDEQGISEAGEMDGTDASCVHLVAYDDNGSAAATGRIVVTRDAFTIGRVAVLPEYRGRDYGTFVMQTLIHACYGMGGLRQQIHAQLSARGFYEKLGFTAYGEVYAEEGIPHISMYHDGDSEALCANGAADGDNCAACGLCGLTKELANET